MAMIEWQWYEVKIMVIISWEYRTVSRIMVSRKTPSHVYDVNSKYHQRKRMRLIIDSI